jgi:two-component system, OmpR family, sensor kinase
MSSFAALPSTPEPPANTPPNSDGSPATSASTTTASNSARTLSVNAVLRTARAPRTIRTRLTVVVSAIATTAIIATLVGIAFGLPRLLQNALDDEQRTRIDRIEQSLTESGKIPDNENFAQVMAPSGNGTSIIDRTPSFSGDALLSSTQLELALSGQNVTINKDLSSLNGSARLFARSAIVNQRPIVIVVGSSLAQLERTRRLLVGALLAGGLALSILTIAGAWLLAGAALRPVQRMTDEAAELAKVTETAGVEGLHKRLDIPRTRDEIAYLGETFNDLLDRVEESVQRERAFVDDASHELRTPLAILRGELELAAAHPGDALEQQLLVSRLAREVDRLANLADDLLVLARARSEESPRYVHVELLSVAARVVGRMGSTVPNIRIEVTGDPVSILWRTDHAERVLNNLVGNAARHAQSHVHVVITKQVGDQAGIDVTDDGKGFPPEFLPHAFERFATADRARTRRHSGTGLGLAIVRELIEARRGTVVATNQATGGAAVRIVIPSDPNSEKVT